MLIVADNIHYMKINSFVSYLLGPLTRLKQIASLFPVGYLALERQWHEGRSKDRVRGSSYIPITSMASMAEFFTNRS